MQITQINVKDTQLILRFDEGKVSIVVANKGGSSARYDFNEISDVNQFLHSCLTAYETDASSETE